MPIDLHKSRWHLACLVNLLVLAMAGGCSRAPERTYPVQGLVTLNGEPLTSGTVLFETLEPTAGGGTYTARGEIDSHGHYTLGTFTADDGAVAGRHRAAIVPSNVGLSDGADHAAASIVPDEYTSPRTSPLQFEVQASSNEINIELTSQPGP